MAETSTTKSNEAERGDTDDKSGARSLNIRRMPPKHLLTTIQRRHAMKNKKHDEIEPQDMPLALSAGHVTEMEDALARLQQMVQTRKAEAELLQRDKGHATMAEILSKAYAFVGDTFDPAHSREVHALLDRLKELGAVVVDRRDVERWRVERAEVDGEYAMREWRRTHQRDQRRF